MFILEAMRPAKKVSRHKSLGRYAIFDTIITWSDGISSAIALAVIAVASAPHVSQYVWFISWPVAYALYAGTRLVTIHPVLLRFVVRLFPKPLARQVQTAGNALRILLLPEQGSSESAQLRSTWILPTLRYFLYVAPAIVAGMFVYLIRWANAGSNLSPAQDSEIWLIFVPAIWLIAQHGRFILVTLVITWAILVNGISIALAYGTSHVISEWGLVVIQSLWLVLIGLLPALFTRYLLDRDRQLEKVMAVLAKLTAIKSMDLENFANEAARTVAELFYPLNTDRTRFDVNILLATTQDENQSRGLRMIGSSAQGAQALIERHYLVPWNQGLTGWVARNQTPRFVNDTTNEKIFLPEKKVFSKTTSELAVPMLLGDELIGVLDVQCTARGMFNINDLNLLKAIVTHLAVALDRAQTMARTRGIYSVSHAMAKALLSRRNLKPVLEQIVTVARTVLQADVVLLYTRNSASAELGDPVSNAGCEASLATALTHMVRYDPDVLAILKSGTVRRLSLSPDTFRKGPSKSRKAGRDAHTLNQTLQEAFLIPLVLDSTTGTGATSNTVLGAIVLAYFQHRSFTLEYSEWFTTLAELATLAVQNALYERLANEERSAISREIHDGMMQSASFSRMLLENVMANLEREGSFSPDDCAKLKYALTLSQALQKQLNYMVGTLRQAAGDTRFFADVHEYAVTVENAMDIRCAFTHQGSDMAITPELSHELRMIIREAVYNATRHGHATEITIDVQIGESSVRLTVADNGRGFDAGKVVRAARGLDNILTRCQRLRGKVDFNSKVGSGTIVGTTIPLSGQPVLSEPVSRRKRGRKRRRGSLLEA